ncbi:MAG: N-formylglutamate amidohydrolase [Alphaproteobacteria bacterium]|nr:N-formylglutamate amidohydrolase [Alphaproteobacteria bacterium]MCB9794466.1 N-formylglutamate amidohydrolase [Alphaproteobacteria bacterium]
MSTVRSMYARYSTKACEPFEFVPNPRAAEGGLCPPELRDRLMVDNVHDGAVIPEEFLLDEDGQPIPEEAFVRCYEIERDWGADLVAKGLAEELGLAGHYRVNIARVLMDFGRFPGMTRQTGDHLDRFAINYPFSSLLSYAQKRRVLENYYDRISERIDQAVRGRIIKVSIHTYDRLNASGTVRPQISLVTRAKGYQADSRMPFGVFDELYPDVLGEFTCSRVLRDRISLTMEKNGLPVAHNYPYLLPEGSIEVRAQVWFFFDFLRKRFEAELPETATHPSYVAVWDMLMDTNLRSATSEQLRSYLHMFRHAPPGREAEFRGAQDAYEQVRRFLKQDGEAIVEAYRRWEDRPSTLALEVRKDLVWEFDAQDRPLRPKPEAARQIGRLLAQAITVYLAEDRPAEHQPFPDYDRGAWYHDLPRA